MASNKRCKLIDIVNNNCFCLLHISKYEFQCKVPTLKIMLKANSTTILKANHIHPSVTSVKTLFTLTTILQNPSPDKAQLKMRKSYILTDQENGFPKWYLNSSPKLPLKQIQPQFLWPIFSVSKGMKKSTRNMHADYSTFFFFFKWLTKHLTKANNSVYREHL